MIELILWQSIMQIESIKKYNKLLDDYLPQQEKEGRIKNVLDRALLSYCRNILSGKNEENLPDDLLIQIRRLVDGTMEIIDYKQDDEGFRVNFRFKDENKIKKRGFETDLSKARREYFSYSNLSSIHKSSILMVLVTTFECFMSSIFRVLIEKHPDGFLNDKSMTYAEIVKQSKNIKEYLIESEISKIMYKGFSDWIKILKTRGLSFDEISSIVDAYNEISLRRNIIVHNDGIVNSIYLNALPEYCEKNSINIGDYLDIDDEYVSDAICVIKVLLYTISFEAIKIDKENSEEILDKITDLAFQHLKDQEWKLCHYIYKRLASIKGQTEIDKTISIINYWIAKKNCNGLESIKKEIETTDFSAFKPIFGMAKDILLENYASAVNTLEEIFPDDISADSIKTWPLFIQFRQTEFYSNFIFAHQNEFDNHTAPNIPVPEVAGKLNEIIDEASTLA